LTLVLKSCRLAESCKASTRWHPQAAKVELGEGSSRPDHRWWYTNENSRRRRRSRHESGF